MTGHFRADSKAKQSIKNKHTTQQRQTQRKLPSQLAGKTERNSGSKGKQHNPNSMSKLNSAASC